MTKKPTQPLTHIDRFKRKIHAAERAGARIAIFLDVAEKANADLRRQLAHYKAQYEAEVTEVREDNLRMQALVRELTAKVTELMDRTEQPPPSKQWQT